MLANVPLASAPIRDGRPAPVTCADCGCRLVGTVAGFVHYTPFAGRDARGCRRPCVELVHRIA
jgi:hypothetical protein